MNTIRRPALQATLAVALLGLLAACGGGGGGSGTQPPTNVAVTAGNQADVASAAMISSTTSSLGGSLGVTATAGGGTQAAALAALRPALMRVMALGATTAKKPAAVFPTGDNCTVSGSFTGSVNDRDGSQTLTVGDTVSVTFSNCVESAGVELDGTMSFTYTQLVASPVTVGAEVSVSSLSVSESGIGYAVSMNGGLVLSYIEPSATTANTVIAVPDALVLGVQTPQISDTVTLLEGFTTNSQYNSTTATTTVTTTGPVASVAAGGYVTVSTPTALVQLDSEDYPHAGVMLSTGVTGKLRATVQSSTSVLLELDANDDGTYEASQTVLWTDLL